MAKRKRLTPARSDFLSSNISQETNLAQQELETKSMFPSGVVKTSPRPPIAQVAGEAAATAALTEMTDMLGKARSEGRIVEALSLDDLEMGHLVRDRISLQSEDLEALKSSLKARGQQTPIEVVDRGTGVSPQYGLISGWRRMIALSEIGITEVLAIVRQPKTSSEAYVAMIEENEIRSDISFYERARVVVKALEQGVYSDSKQALQTLFSNVSRAKRSKIKSFMTLVEALDNDLRFPSTISERLGLEIVKKITEDPNRVNVIKARLAQEPHRTVQAELAILLSDGPLAKKTERQSNIEMSFDAAKQTVALQGDGVTPDLVAALKKWLLKR
jgi:ParB/RepB/Spo0J family partition protein